MIPCIGEPLNSSVSSGQRVFITIDDKVKFDAKTENAMKQRAIENGLLEKAQKNAEDILKLLIQADAAVGDNYTIEFVASK